MKFYIESTMYGDKEEDLVKHYPWLKEFEYQDGHITVKSFKTLMKLVDKSGRDGIILTHEREVYDPKLKKWIGTGVPDIEIYDWYRE